MKKLLCITLVSMIILSLSACGISSDDYNAVILERDNLKQQLSSLQDQLDSLENRYNMLQSEYNKYKEETADWTQLSEEEKAAKLAQAEVERIAAEEAEAQAKAKQEAAEKAAAEEAARKAEAERAAKEAEEKLGYETGITYDNLARNPDNYYGKRVKFTGSVLQVIENTGVTMVRLATKQDSWVGYIDDIIYLYIGNELIDSRILEDDIITIYGVSKGLYTYEAVMGNTVTLPIIQVNKIEQNS